MTTSVIHNIWKEEEEKNAKKNIKMVILIMYRINEKWRECILKKNMHNVEF